MNKEIIINSAINEVRVAITENGELAEFFIELPDKERYVGNIYLGSVNKINTGINAAFINIGLNQDAFLHFSDVDESLENTLITDEDDDEEDAPPSDGPDIKTPQKQSASKKKKTPAKAESNTDIALRKTPSTQDKKNGSLKFHTKRSGDVHINLEENQNVIVQVTREAYANKGVKVTSKIGLPGRYTVLLPFDKMLGVSRKIASFTERKRLRKLARKVLPDGYGCIIRTASQGKSEEEMERDLTDLITTWENIEKKVENTSKPTLLYQDMQLAGSVIRDLFTTDVERVVIDSKKLYKELKTYIKRVSPHLENKLILYTGKVPVFEEYGVERELAKTYKRTVSLHGGGDVVIEQTEAMTVVDVNSGRSYDVDQENNSLKTNLEAAHEVAKQIRLRDIGGMVIIDFIDMYKESNRRKLFNHMKRELSKDRAKTVAYPLTQLGLLQITRQRINQNIVEKVSEICPACNGTGRITSKSVLVNHIERWLGNFRKDSREFRLILNVHPIIAEYITEGTISTLSKLMIKYFVKINVQQNESIKIDHFKFFSVRQQKDITHEYLAS